jgi:hypothetical protein
MNQGELFINQNTNPNPSQDKISFFSRFTITLGFDKILLLALCGMGICVISFIFGSEQGKRSLEVEMAKLQNSQVDRIGMVASKGLTPEEEVIPVPAEVQRSFEEETVIVIHHETPGIETGEIREIIIPKRDRELPLVNNSHKADFTLQLVTYTNEALAFKEVQRLNGKGFESFVIPSGSFLQICVNYFASKDAARSMLDRVRATGRYPDAFIRPVIR